MSCSLLSILALCANFTFYVTFVQFALLHYLTGELKLTFADLRGPLGALAVCGILGSLGAGVFLDGSAPNRKRQWTAAAIFSLALAILAAVSFPLARSGRIVFLFALLGLVLGAQIVLLLALFSTSVPAPKRGLFAGLAAGASYLAANLIAGYAAVPRTAASIDALLVAAAGAAILFSRSRLDDGETEDIGKEGSTLWSLALAMVPLAMLVAVDSFTFYPLGGGGTLVHAIFAAPSDWLQNGVFHFLFAVAAGAAYAKIGFRRTVQAAGAAMAAAALALLLNLVWDLSVLVRLLYSAVVGIYTVGFFASFSEAVPRTRPFTGIAVGVILIGWLANPLGIALAQALFPSVGFTGLFLLSLAGSLVVLWAAFRPMIPTAER